VISLAVVALALMLSLPAGAKGLDGGEGVWTPGQVLIRFHVGVGPAARERIAARAHVTLENRLPAVPNLWEAMTRGAVSHAVRILDHARRVDYAQPDYVAHDRLEAAPAEPAYWPNDPYFWPARFANSNRCEVDPGASDKLLAGWPYWPSGTNLTDPVAPLGVAFNPLSAGDRAEQANGNVMFANYRSIDVLPVWNLLRDGGRLGSPAPNQQRRWTAAGIERFGVAVMDTGIANHPDVAPQVAAEFSTVSKRIGGGPDFGNEITEFYTDNPNRNDIAHVQAALPPDPANHPNRRNLTITEANRPLFALDDTNVLSATKWSPTVENQPVLPTGCDGPGSRRSSAPRPTTRSGRRGSVTTSRWSGSGRGCHGIERRTGTRATTTSQGR
jgi:hypothetical protein